MKTKTIFTRKLAYELRLRGHSIVAVKPNPYKPEFNVWIFEDSDRLEKDLTEITKNDKTITKEDNNDKEGRKWKPSAEGS